MSAHPLGGSGASPYVARVPGSTTDGSTGTNRRDGRHDVWSHRWTFGLRDERTQMRSRPLMQVSRRCLGDTPMIERAGR